MTVIYDGGSFFIQVFNLTMPGNSFTDITVAANGFVPCRFLSAQVSCNDLVAGAGHTWGFGLRGSGATIAYGTAIDGIRISNSISPGPALFWNVIVYGRK